MPFAELSALPDSGDHRELAFTPSSLTSQQITRLYLTLLRADIRKGLAPLLP